MARVLVVQEAGAERRAMQTALEDEGYEVLLIGTGAQAVAAVTHVRVDVIIVHADSVQDGGGFLRCRQLGERRTPVILATVARATEFESLGPAVVGVLRKPFALEDLRQALARAGAKPQRSAKRSANSPAMNQTAGGHCE